MKTVIKTNLDTNEIINRLAGVLPSGKTVGDDDDKLILVITKDHRVQLQAITNDISINIDVTDGVTVDQTADDNDQADDDRYYAVLGKEFAKAVNTLDNDTTITITDTNNNDIHVATMKITDAAKHRLTLQILPKVANSIFTAVNDGQQALTTDLPMTMMADIDKMAQAATAQVKQTDKEFLKNVKLMIAKDSGLTAWASDSHNLMKYHNDSLSYDNDTNLVCLASLAGWHKATTLFSKLAADNVQLASNDRVISLKAGNMMMVINHYGTINGFTSVDKIINIANNDNYVIQIDADTLDAALSRCQLLQSPTGVNIMVMNDNKLRLTVNSDDNDYCEELPCMSVKTNNGAELPLSINVNVSELKALTKVMADNLLTIKIAQALAPIYMHANLDEHSSISTATALIKTFNNNQVNNVQ